MSSRIITNLHLTDWLRPCHQRHKNLFFNPLGLLRAQHSSFSVAVQKPGDLILTHNHGSHQGYNTGNNLAIAVNWATKDWIFKTRAAIFTLWHMILSMIACASKGQKLVFLMISGLQMLLMTKNSNTFTPSKRKKKSCLYLSVLQVQLGVNTSSLELSICTKLATQFHGWRKRGRWRVEKSAWICNDLYNSIVF